MDTRHTLFTFLGTGPESTPAGAIGYSSVTYALGPRQSSVTPFAQAAIVELLGADAFERVVILTTRQSEERHLAPLLDALSALGLPPDRITHLGGLSTSQTPDQQWSWFSRLIEHVPRDASVIFDFTHGFRSVPIIFSAALGFVQRVRGARLAHAFYGWVEGKPPVGNLIDMADFYRIHDWASAVSQLVDTASADALAQVSAQEPADSPFAALNDPGLIEAFRALTGIVKNIEVNAVGPAADKALGLIADRLARSGPATRPLLELVIAKFQDLGGASEAPRHGGRWFELQLSLVAVLLRHGLAMQAFTVLHESIAAMGLTLLDPASKYVQPDISKDKARNYRRRFGAMFTRMTSIPEPDWRWQPDEERATVSLLRPGWERLKQQGLASRLHALAAAISRVRNGFDHAWTGAATRPDDDLGAQGLVHLQELTAIFRLALERGAIHAP